jgi:hypothetical protein
MAIMTCYDCGHDVSSDAESCPSCGAMFETKSKASGCSEWAWALVCVLVILMGGCYLLSANRTPEQKATAERSLKDSKYRQGVKDYLRSNLRDWDSYESVKWSYAEEGSNGNVTIIHKYRAKNGLGGYNLTTQIFELNDAGKVVDVVGDD